MQAILETVHIFFLKARYSNIDVFLLFQNSKNALTWVHEDIFEAFVRSFWRKKIVSKVAEKVCNALLRRKKSNKACTNDKASIYCS